MDRAFACRYGHQDIYRLLGRDPAEQPLTRFEYAVFIKCIEKHWEAEIKARAGITPDVSLRVGDED